MSLIKVLALLGTLLMLVGCLLATTLTGSGQLVTQEQPISGFDKVDISHSFEVDINQGENYSVVIRVDDNLVEHLRVEKQGSTLKIGLNPTRDYTINNATLQAEVSMPELIGLDSSGASHATITGFKSTQDLSVDLSGSSSLRGDIEAGNVSIDLSGSSHVTLSGSGQDLSIDMSGGSDLDFSDFPTVDTRISASGSSTATVNTSGRLDVDASGSSDIFYLGSPTLGEISTSGSSSVEPK